MKKRLRIAVWHNLPSGGGKRALYDHVSGLVDRGHYVESWSPPTADQTYLPLKNFCREHVVPLSSRRPILPWLNRGRRVLESWKILSDLSAMDKHCRECASEINRGNFDVLFANACTFFRTTSIARHVRIPSTIYLGEPYRWLYEALPDPPWAAPPKGDRGTFSVMEWSTGIGDFVNIQSMRVQVREEIRNAAAFNTILVNSLFSRESVLRAYGLESTVCYLGIDPERFKPTGELPESFVMCLGGLSFQKGPERAIRAIGAVDASKRPDLVWVGNFSERGYEGVLQKLAADCRVKLTIKVRVSDDELVSMLSRAAMLLYTSRLEPFGLSPLEANACGTPVVAIAEGGIRESIVHERNGLLVDGDDPLQLAKAIERLIDDRSFSDEMRKRALSHVNARWKMTDAIDRIESELIKLSENDVRMSEHRLVVQP